SRSQYCFPYTTLFRSRVVQLQLGHVSSVRMRLRVELGSSVDLVLGASDEHLPVLKVDALDEPGGKHHPLAKEQRTGVHNDVAGRSEDHTSELQSRSDL